MRYNHNMSDATSINAILSQRVSADKATPNSKLVEIPKALENMERSQNLRGTVTRRDNDGTITIKTDKGEVKAKLEQNITVQKGDNIAININKGNPPQSANIKLAPKITGQQIQSPNLTQALPKIAQPQNLSAQELITQDLIKVDLLTPQLVQKLTNPYIEIINTKANLTMIFSIEQNIGSSVINLTQDLNKLPTPSILEIFALPASNADNKDIGAAFKMTQPKTEMPLRFILTQSIASPAYAPISISSISLETPAPSAFTQIKISNITHPFAQIEHGESYTQPNERAGDVRAVLAGFTQDKNFPVLKITLPQNHGEQHYALQIPIEDIPLGTQIELNITKSTNITPITAQIIIGHNSFVSPDIWPIMQEITQALAQVNPAVTKAFSNIMPNPAAPVQLGSAALFFLAAMRSGDVQSWLGGKAIELLKQAGKSELITRLGGEFSALNRMSNDNTQEWRSLSLPLAWQDEIHKSVIHYRKEGSQDGSEHENERASKTRFVMNLNLSQMGKIQLDGLFVGDPDGAGRLDLILRTEQSFSAAMKMEMRQKYKAALDETTFTGELAFQDNPEQWVNITANAKSEFLRDV